MASTPFFHDQSGALRFWVTADDGTHVGASISKETLHFRFRGQPGGEDALVIYAAHREEIDDAVRRRLASGSLEPVMLREFDVAVRG